MATPKVCTDGSTDLDEGVLNLYLNAIKAQVKVNYFRFKKAGADDACTVVAGNDSDGEVVSADVTWNSGSTRVDITLSGFTVAPVVIATIASLVAASTVAEVHASTTSLTNATITFYGAGADPSAVDPAFDVEVNVLIIGA